MSETENKKVPAKRAGTDVSPLNFDSYFDKDYNDNIDNNTIIIPRVKIIQGTTNDKGDGKEGEFLNNVTKKSYGNIIIFVSVFHWLSRILFVPKKLDIMCRAVDGIKSSGGEFEGKLCAECEKSKWGDDKPECNQIYNYAIAILDEVKEAIKTRIILAPTILSFMSAATKTAKFINTNIRINTGRRIPIWANIIELTTEKKKFETTSAWMPIASIIGVIQTKENADYLNQLHKAYQKMSLNTSLKDIGQEIHETPKEETVNQAKESSIDDAPVSEKDELF